MQDADCVSCYGYHDSDGDHTVWDTHGDGGEHQQSRAADVHHPGSQQSNPAVH